MARPLLTGATRLTLALDDTPTRRHGPRVQVAGVHHNPAPGPAGPPCVHGHVFVVLGLLAAHKAWGTIARPLLARLYVRKKDLPAVDPGHRPASRTGLGLAAEPLRWVKPWLDLVNLPTRVVADGASAKKDFLEPTMSSGMAVVSRLREDAALRTVPGPPTGRRGRPRPHGADEGDLAKRAGQRRGRSSETLTPYGVASVEEHETFPATWRPARGVIRAVLVGEPKGGRASSCTDASASVADITGMAADRPPRPGDHPRRLQGDRRCRPAAGAVLVGGHRGVPRLPVGVHADRGVGLESEGRGRG